MGKFLAAEELKTLTTVPGLRFMDLEQLERPHIQPAERRLEEMFGLDLETSRTVPPVDVPEDIPCYWRSRMDQHVGLKQKFMEDMNTSVVLLVHRMASNPDGLIAQGVGGASVTHGRSLPTEISAIMARWRLPRQVYRT